VVSVLTANAPEAKDNDFSDAFPDGNPNYWYGNVAVETGPVRIIGDILCYPSVFKPLSEGETRIAYNLSKDANISVYIYDASGQVILTKKFASGVVGGRAGYNDFTWNGIMDIGGYVGNGIYIIQITSGNSLVATGKLVVFD